MDDNEQQRLEKFREAMLHSNENLDGITEDSLERKMTGYKKKRDERSIQELMFDDDDDE